MAPVLWQPSAEWKRASQLWRFAERTAAMHGCAPDDYAGLHRWSVEQPEAFWSAAWDELEIVGEKGSRIVAEDGFAGTRFFPDARLNFAENLLRFDGDDAAIIFRNEDGASRNLSRHDLREEVSRLQQAMRRAGVTAGDRVAAVTPNVPEAVALMLAAASIGAIWSSCSPDFGARGILDRFEQIAPRLLIVPDGYRYNGRQHDVSAAMREVVSALSAETVVVLDNAGQGTELAASIENGVRYADFIAPFAAGPLQFERLGFSHPLYVMFSSGTTGKPKCIIHSAGGALLQQVKEHRLHVDLHPGDRMFFYTTCGWMMWNWLVSALASGVALCLYDGAPTFPTADHLFDYAAEVRFAVFGTSARYIDTLRNRDLTPSASRDLSALRTILSTGSPLSPDCFDYVYERIGADIHLASISGGTDILSCFVGGVPTLPVHRGEIQAAGLGMAVDVFDEGGSPLPTGKGELVCLRPFPSMPVGFWNDEDGRKYRAAYFERFPGIWAHGDLAEHTPSGGYIIHGRSDATLNPGGVRIGTAEIYGIVESMAEIDGALCVAQEWQNDVRVVLFVQLAAGVALDDELRAKIGREIRKNASPRHVPSRIIAVTDLPRTRSGKLTEIAVRDVIHGRAVGNLEAIANPAALDQFRDLPELRS